MISIHRSEFQVELHVTSTAEYLQMPEIQSISILKFWFELNAAITDWYFKLQFNSTVKK